MTSKYPNISGEKIAKRLEDFGFEKIRQKGGHIRYKKGNIVTTIPNHKEVKRGTLVLDYLRDDRFIENSKYLYIIVFIIKNSKLLF